MIVEITNNPFRILGLPANATREEIDQCYHVLTESLKQQNQPTESVKDIEDAYHAVTSPEHHWHHASFWFVCISDKDRHAVQYVEEGRYEAAIRIWEEKLNYASLHNMMLCYVLMGEYEIHNYEKAFYYARCLFLGESNFDLFVDCVGVSDKVAADEANVFLDVVFSQTVAEKSTLYALLGNKTWMEYVRGKWVEANEADAGAENMRNYINMAEHAKKASDAEESRNSFFKWLWWLLFPVLLTIYYMHKCENDAESHKAFQELITPMDKKSDNINPSEHIQIDSNLNIKVDKEYIEHLEKKFK